MDYSFSSAGGTQTLSIETNIPLEVVSNDISWCTVTKVLASATTHQYSIITTANTTAQARQTVITITGQDTKNEVLVSQQAAEIIEITNEKKTLELNDNGGEYTINLITNGEYSISINKGWIKELAKTDTSLTVLVNKNFGLARTGTITFTLGNTTTKYVISQSTSPEMMSSTAAMSLAHSFGLGWNMGNQLDAHSNGKANETIWGNQATTQQAFNKIKAAGIQSVRIPVTWLGHIGAGPEYKITDTWLNRVAEVVGYAENAGLKAIINIHHDGADSHYWLNIKNAAINETANTQVKAQIHAMWTQIANKFKDKGNFLVFESLNEIHDGGWGWGTNRTDGGKQYAVLNDWNQVFVDAVRATGGNNVDRYLGLPGYVTNPQLTIDHFVLPADIVANRLMVAVHYYDPYEYTLNDKYSEWGHTAASDKKESYGDEGDMKTMFGKLKTKFVDKGIPMYIGEFGCVHRSTARAESFRKYYLEYICKAAKTYGLAPFYWDNGSTNAGRESSGLINHATGEYINNGKEMIDVMVKAMTNQDASYTLDAVYNSAPQ
ncbi:MAG: cellulase family glycosylhydrolase [Marinilabiliaceae bacterium]|nr:cellulase family glycosylhydrolase [Marinilabiliaceae bacterium]